MRFWGLVYFFPLCKYGLETSQKLMVLATDADLYIGVHAFKYNFKWKCVCVSELLFHCMRLILYIYERVEIRS